MNVLEESAEYFLCHEVWNIGFYWKIGIYICQTTCCHFTEAHNIKENKLPVLVPDLLVTSHTPLWTFIISFDCHSQDLTGIEDISVCRDVLQRHAWDLEVSVQDQLNIREGHPSVFASDIRTPAVVNDRSTQHIFFSPPRDSNPHSIRGLFKYVVSLILQLCYNTISNILQFTFRLFQPDTRRCEYCWIIVYIWEPG